MATIRIIGLGAGDLAQMPLGVYQTLQQAIAKEETIYLRTKEHPVVETLVAEGLLFESFDALYEAEATFEGVYEKITQRLLALAQEKGDLLYAVPGHPMVAEKVVQMLLAQESVSVQVVGGKSFLDDLLQAVGLDIIDGFQLVDALDFSCDEILLTKPLIVMQVFNAYVASDVKLTLMERYPDDYQVALIHAAGTSQEKVDWMPLYDLDRLEGVYNLSSLYVPAMERDEATKSFETLQVYMDQVAAKDLWLQEQSHASLLPYLREEVQEVAEAIEKDDLDNLIEELGDVLWQVLFQTSVAEYEGYFNLEDVLDVLNRKIRRRHPHVFDGIPVSSVADIEALWQEAKRKEKEGQNP